MRKEHKDQFKFKMFQDGDKLSQLAQMIDKGTKKFEKANKQMLRDKK